MKNNNSSTESLSRKYVNILGINVISTTKDKVLMNVKEFISHNNKFYITTPNPELVLMSQSNNEVKEALNNSDFSIPDGIGLAQAARLLSLKTPRNNILRFLYTFFAGIFIGVATLVNKKWLTRELNIIKGRELFIELIELASKNKWKVFLFGGLNDEAQKTAEILKKKNKDLKIKYVSGPLLNEKAEPESKDSRKIYFDTIREINSYAPHLLFVAMQNPKQEIWLYKNINKLKIGGAMTVGGTFRYVGGISKPLPKFFDSLGIEWVWRLITEPHRFRRIFNAFPIFPLKVWESKLRENVR
jgi:N-acetylglucosaminyldiphosphoundecaprenol N-acetyl-beta-D-mannosaminyltransferase